MKTFTTLLGLVFVAAIRLSAQDAIDIHAAQIVDAPPAADWPITTSITSVSFINGVTSVDFTKKAGPDKWTELPAFAAKTCPGDGCIQYTLWLFRLIDSRWVGSAFIQFWDGRPGSGSASDPDVPSKYDQHWYFSSRWAPLNGSGPIRPGETIAFMVSHGNARDSAGTFAPERSNVVTFPATDAGTINFTSAPPPVEIPPPVVGPPVVVPPPPPAVDLQPLLDQVFALGLAVDDLTAQLRALTARVTALEAKPIPATCTVSAFGVPVRCTLK